jgi:chemotaxis protein MotB
MLEDDDEAPPGAPGWIVTFADLLSLLLTFFILLLSISNTQLAKFEAAAGSLKDALGMSSELDLSDQPKPGASFDSMTPENLDQELQKLLTEIGGRRRGIAFIAGDGGALNISGDLMFASGEAAVSPEAIQVLDRIADYLLQSDRPLDVIGHTDNVPISTPLYPSNWELSAARAGSAVRYLASRGIDAQRLRAIGRASTRPVVSNSTAEGRSLNRRVEFVFNLQQEAVEYPSAGSAAKESRQE